MDPRGIATARDAREAEFSILRADAVGRRREFLASEDNVCGTCFADDVRGAEMRRVSASCGHRFCVDCVTRMARVHVREGTVNELVCPHPDCSSSMDPQTLREVLDDEEFAKFEAIALSKALDAMQDLVYCLDANIRQSRTRTTVADVPGVCTPFVDCVDRRGTRDRNRV